MTSCSPALAPTEKIFRVRGPDYMILRCTLPDGTFVERQTLRPYAVVIAVLKGDHWAVFRWSENIGYITKEAARMVSSKAFAEVRILPVVRWS